MAKVLIVGSRKSFDPGEFQRACRSIGAALARHGHTIVAAGCGADDAETWVLEGANAASSADRKTTVIPFAPALPDTQDLLVLAPKIAGEWTNLLFQPPFKTKGPWAVGQAVALIRSDVALLIGGGALTANVGSLALELDKPYYAVSELGGTAQVVASEDYAKHKAMGMPEDWLNPQSTHPKFGEIVVEATEFIIKQRKDRTVLRNNSIILTVSLAVLGCFLGILFRHDPLGNEAQLVYITCLGAMVGVMLAFLIGRFGGGEPIQPAALIGQASLACFLGVLYGFFALHAGTFYGVTVNDKWTIGQVDSLAIKLGLLGVGVGALVGPASRKILEELGQTAKLKSERH